jgi:hypothetical protein
MHLPDYNISIALHCMHCFLDVAVTYSTYYSQPCKQIVVLCNLDWPPQNDRVTLINTFRAGFLTKLMIYILLCPVVLSPP